MKIYLDDDLASRLLTRLLRKPGHDVQIPLDVGMSGKDDPVHLAHAVICMSRNYTDFENLHDLVVAVGGHHPGILVVRQDNDPRRDLTPHGIVKATHNIMTAGVPITDQYIVLNHWR